MNLIDKAKNLAESAVVWVLAGMPIVDRDTYERRLYICSMCNYLKDGTCTHCGCVMKTKAWLATEGCADQAHPKWDKANDQ